jgi:hypothetical protein
MSLYLRLYLIIKFQYFINSNAFKIVPSHLNYPGRGRKPEILSTIVAEGVTFLHNIDITSKKDSIPNILNFLSDVFFPRIHRELLLREAMTTDSWAGQLIEVVDRYKVFKTAEMSNDYLNRVPDKTNKGWRGTTFSMSYTVLLIAKMIYTRIALGKSKGKKLKFYLLVFSESIYSRLYIYFVHLLISSESIYSRLYIYFVHLLIGANKSDSKMVPPPVASQAADVEDTPQLAVVEDTPQVADVESKGKCKPPQIVEFFYKY